MRNKFLTSLEASYAFVLGVNILLPVLYFHAQIRAVILLVVFSGVFFTHIIICLNRDASQVKRRNHFFISLACG